MVQKELCGKIITKNPTLHHFHPFFATLLKTFFISDFFSFMAFMWYAERRSGKIPDFLLISQSLGILT